MGQPLFTVLIPVHRPPHLLPFAINSVLAQTEPDFVVFVICDGAPRETVECAAGFAARDPRIRVFDFEKGERLGEAHRHTALGEATSRYVAQIADDDFWFPDYLAELAQLLANVDFGNLLQTELSPKGVVRVFSGDLADQEHREGLRDGRWNFFGPTFAGYRLDAYRRLPTGWSAAPPDIATDAYMWRKFLRCPDLRAGTRFSVQGIRLSAKKRKRATMEWREAEQRAVAARLARPEERRDIQARAFQALFGALRSTVEPHVPTVAT